jgi:adenosylhomocysteine nucleosidase
MMLRWLVNNLLRDAVQQTVSSLRPADEQQPPDSEDAEPMPPPPCEIAVIFALGIEAGGLVDRLQDRITTQFKTHVEHAGYFEGRRMVVVETGVGREAAADTTQAVLALHNPLWVISAGFAGALHEDLRRGHVLMANEVADVDQHRLTIELNLDEASAANSPGLHIGRLLTVDRLIRTKAEKEQLGKEHAALACDMETFAVVQVCQTAKKPCLAVRVVSDGLEDELPKEIERLLDQTTWAAKLGAAAGAIFQRPSSVKDMWKLNEEAIKASDRLARFLTGVVAQLPKAG